MTYLNQQLPLTEQRLSSLLAALADKLDISDELYEEATLKYEEVTLWLSDDEELGQYSPVLFPQGSFRLGTVVHPVHEECDYDIDLVCHLDIDKESITQKELKEKIGQRLRANEELAKVLTPSRRCWKLRFPQQFHMDVLPAIPNAEMPPTGILLTDTELTRWQKSNPKAYGDWFYTVMAVQFEKRRVALAEALRANVEDVPEWRVKTPLQRTVQLLKRHRDILFEEDMENRPVSIIITTLAAHAYRNQEDLREAVLEIVEDMPSFIENRDGKWWVANPVEPGENFADKWNERPERLDAFLHWLGRVRADLQAATDSGSLNEAVEKLSRSFGDGATSRGKAKLLPEAAALELGNTDSLRPLPDISSEVSHCQPPAWPLVLRYKAKLTGSLHIQRNGKRIAELSRRRIRKHTWLKFSLNTNAPSPYEVYWQVVNTGAEAAGADALRGTLFIHEEGTPNIHWETTEYSGLHWIEGFVIKDGMCVARSGRKYVCVA